MAHAATLRGDAHAQAAPAQPPRSWTTLLGVFDVQRKGAVPAVELARAATALGMDTRSEPFRAALRAAAIPGTELVRYEDAALAALLVCAPLRDVRPPCGRAYDCSLGASWLNHNHLASPPPRTGRSLPQPRAAQLSHELRAALRHMCESLSPARLLHELRRFDADGRGAVLHREVAEAFARLAAPLPQTRMRELILAVDATQSGVVDAEALCRLVAEAAASRSAAPSPTRSVSAAAASPKPSPKPAPRLAEAKVQPRLEYAKLGESDAKGEREEAPSKAPPTPQSLPQPPPLQRSLPTPQVQAQPQPQPQPPRVLARNTWNARRAALYSSHWSIGQE